MKFTKEQIEAVVNWMNDWEQLRGTAIPIRFEEDFRKTELRDIIKRKVNYYGFTEAAIDFAINEYENQ